MGKYRSKSGCRTCRQRRVKCDEEKPVCGQCGKKNRDCQWESPKTQFREYRPEGTMEVEKEADVETGEHGADGHVTESSAPSSQFGVRSRSHPGSSSSSLALASPATNTGSPSSTVILRPASLPTHQACPLSRKEAQLVHHYAETLGRWLDGCCPARQFTLAIPSRTKHCEILLRAITCFSARHLHEDDLADEAYQRCLALLIERLGLHTATHDDDLLCAIVILRFFEQLNVAPDSGSDHEQHLAGSSAILRASQTTTVDPSAPTLREAAFWVYVRQCLYIATINQQPPNLDFSLKLHPEPSSMQDSHPLATLRLETGWTNQMAWNCACVVNYCFDGNPMQERSIRMERWQCLWDLVQQWERHRPMSFEPIWVGLDQANSTFPEMWFTADWHAIAFGYYHFACILLLNYKPGPKFAIRSVSTKLTDTDYQILEHARAICGSCKSSPKNVPCLMTLCHTIFIWGPLLTLDEERKEVLQMLVDFEITQRWPTAWIVKALCTEWGLDRQS